MVNYATLFGQIGAELQVMRGLEAVHEWASRVNSSYFRDKINAAYDNTVVDEDVVETSSKTNLQDAVAPGLADLHNGRQASFEEWFFPFLDEILTTSPEDQAAGAISYAYDETLLANGQVQISERTGRWGALRRQMQADSQTIRKNVVTFGALTAASGNQGVLVDSGVSGEDHLLSGTLVFEVTDDTVGAVQLSATLLLTNPLINGDTLVEAGQAIRVGQSFQEGLTGLSITLDLSSVVETGDDGAMISGSSILNPSEEDSNKGKHYITVTRVGTGASTVFRIRWYNSADLEDEDLVTEKDTAAGIVGTEVMTLIGSLTTITFTFDKAAANTHLPADTDDDLDIVLDIKSPRLGDRWTKTAANDESGVIATKIARRWRASLNSTANPGQTISDALAASLTMT